MLKKLIKHDIKDMTQILNYMYVCLIGLAILTRLIGLGDKIHFISIIHTVFKSIMISAIVTVLINTFTNILKVFIYSFYKDESYLTHTLPIKKETLILSKYISSLIVIIESIVICVIAAFITFYTKTLFADLKAILDVALSGFNMSTGLVVTLFILIIFAEVCAIVSMSFAAIIKGQQSNTKKTLNGFISFFAFYFASMILTVAISAIVFAIKGDISQLFSEKLSQSAFLTILVIGLVLYVLYSILFYFISKKEFKKGVNVE